MLTEIQKKLLDMLKWFDEYCSKNNIEYYIAGGTLLGVIRHRGLMILT